MSNDFVKKTTEMAVNLSCNDGDNLFKIGDKAEHFYILLKGNVLLDREVGGEEHHTAREPGEVVGWSTLIKRDVYAASATCRGDVQLQQFERDHFFEILAEKAEDQSIFFERIAQMLGNQILDSQPFLA